MHEQIRKTRLHLLMEIFQIIEISNYYPKLLYSLLAKNQDKLDEYFQQILEEWVATTLKDLELEESLGVAEFVGGFSNLIMDFKLGKRSNNLEIAIKGYTLILPIYNRDTFPEEWAKTQNNLAIAYGDRIQGSRAENLEQAIIHYQFALQIYTHNKFPKAWSTIQNNLANTYRNRIHGSKAENLEKAIAYYQSALQIRTYEACPQEWAMTQNNLANAYNERIHNSKAENLEKAIACYQSALKVYTHDTFPENRAITLNNLAVAYSNRIHKSKAENLEKAITCYQSALKVCTRDTFPKSWAITLNNLAVAYSNRIRGEKAENLEQAIICYQAALEVRTRESDPREWAMTQNNLATCYCNRIRGDKSENLEQAIACCQSALQVYTRDAFPQSWAATQNTLANAYSERICGDKSENLEQAVICCQSALQVYTRDAFPQSWAMIYNTLGSIYSEIQEDNGESLEQAILYYQLALQIYARNTFPSDWATTQNNLGNAYRKRVQGDKSENLEQAIFCYQAALKVYTRDAFPYNWATTQNNLAITYRKRIQGDKSRNLEQAIALYRSALHHVLIREKFPHLHAGTRFNLGLAYYDNQQLQNAQDAFSEAISTVENLRDEIALGNEIKQKLAEEWNTLYQCMTKTCLALNEQTKAIEYAERSKTRNLIELIFSRDLYNIFPSDVASQLEQLRDEIASKQYELQNAKVENSKLLVENLQSLRQQRNQLQDLYLPIGSSFNFDRFHESLDDKTVIFEWYILGDILLTFIITRTSGLQVRQSRPDDLKNLMRWASDYINNCVNRKSQLRDSLLFNLKELSDILGVNEFISCPELVECNRLILIPHRYLHLFPLHILPLSNKELLMDRFEQGVSYAPSCQLLQLTQRRQRSDFKSLLAIQNPTDDLLFSGLEVKTISSLFSSTNILVKQEASKATIETQQEVSSTNCIHFSCHGFFNFSNSALVLAGKQHFTLREIFNLNLDMCRLVTLSACETGMTDPTSISDEYIGLSSGFLYAGSQSVVSSLWAVNDLSTAFLMFKFYENLAQLPQTEAGSVAVALNQAQRWLRDLTSEEAEELLDKLKPYCDEVLSQVRPGQRLIFQESLKQIRQRQPLPFTHPHYWAAFTAVGL